MNHAAITASPRRLVATGLVLVTAALCLVVALVHPGSSGPSTRRERADGSGHPSLSVRPSAVPTTTESTGPSATATTSESPTSLPLVRTDDPDAYARAVAQALFGVAQADVSRAAYLRFWTGELPTVVYSDGAAKGLTLHAQNADAIDNLTAWWIPTQAVWDSEAAQDTISRFLVTSVSVPDYWANAVADGTLRDPGLRMERVMGVLTQSYGTDPGERQTSARSIVIDLGLLCGPTQAGGCRLLAPQQPPSPGE